MERKIFYREHSLAYPLPQFCDMWWSQGFNPYYNFTGSIPLLTPYHSFITCGGHKVFTSTTTLQGACPFLPPTTVLLHVVVTKFSPLPQPYREHSLAYPYHSFITCGGHKVFTSTTTLQGAFPFLPPTTVLGHVVVTKLSPLPQPYREHSLAYPLPQFYDMWWSQSFRLHHNS